MVEKIRFDEFLFFNFEIVLQFVPLALPIEIDQNIEAVSLTPTLKDFSEDFESDSFILSCNLRPVQNKWIIKLFGNPHKNQTREQWPNVVTSIFVYGNSKTDRIFNQMSWNFIL